MPPLCMGEFLAHQLAQPALAEPHRAQFVADDAAHFGLGELLRGHAVGHVSAADR